MCMNIELSFISSIHNSWYKSTFCVSNTHSHAYCLQWQICLIWIWNCFCFCSVLFSFYFITLSKRQNKWRDLREKSEECGWTILISLEARARKRQKKSCCYDTWNQCTMLEYELISDMMLMPIAVPRMSSVLMWKCLNFADFVLTTQENCLTLCVSAKDLNPIFHEHKIDIHRHILQCEREREFCEFSAIFHVTLWLSSQNEQ